MHSIYLLSKVLVTFKVIIGTDAMQWWFWKQPTNVTFNRAHNMKGDKRFQKAISKAKECFLKD